MIEKPLTISEEMELGIVWLVRAAWIGAILPMVIAFIPTSKLSSFHQLVLGFAGRGKILQSSSQVFYLPSSFSYFNVKIWEFAGLLLSFNLRFLDVKKRLKFVYVIGKFQFLFFVFM